MHRSTRIITMIEIASLLLIIVASWLSQSATIRAYVQAGVLGLAVLTGILSLGWARPRGENNKIASVILILIAIIFQLGVFALLGTKLGFVANVYLLNWTSIFQVFLPIGLIITFTEILRGQAIDKGQGSRGVIIMTAVVLSLLQMAVYLPIYLPLTTQSFCELLLCLALPTALTNVLLTYIAYTYDYRANIAYQLIMEMPVYLLPIYPDVSNFLKASLSIGLSAALIIGFVSVGGWGGRLTEKSRKRVRIKRRLNDRQQKALSIAKYTGIGLVIIATLSFTGLMSGLFHYYFLAVGSGSMEPALNRGDLVLVEKTSDYDKIAEGMVIVYRHQDQVIIHRVSEIELVGKRYLYHTRGDANNGEDVWLVEQDDVIGVAKNKITMFGFPTLWLNELFNIGE